MPRSTTYSIAGGQLAALETGDPQTADLSVVFLHGWLDNAASFRTVLSELQPRLPGVHLCAIDLPGHGLSSHKPDNHFYPFHHYIDDVYQFLAHFSTNKQVLVGHSLGALIASCYSAAFPDQVVGLVQIEGIVPLSEAPEFNVDRLRRGVLSRQRIRRKPERGYHSFEQALKRRSEANQIAPPFIAPVVERGLAQVDGQWRWRHDTRLKSESLYRMTSGQVEAIISQIRCPQRIVLGEQGYPHLKEDRRISPDDRLEMFTIPGGHHCHLEQPALVAELILGLVNKI